MTVRSDARSHTRTRRGATWPAGHGGETVTGKDSVTGRYAVNGGDP